jgi:signal transduction histidine kinase
MIISQLLLIAFVVQWLISQYSNEKNDLEKNLALQFEQSQQEVLDTLLEHKLIGPLLRNPNGFKINTIDVKGNISDEHISNSDSNQVQKFDSKNSPPATTVKMYVSRKGNIDTSSTFTVITDNDTLHKKSVSEFNDSAKDILLHGVKMIVKEVSKSGMNDRSFERHIYSLADTSMMKIHIARHLRDKGWNFNVNLVNVKDSDSLHKGNKTFYFESSLFPETFGLEIKNYRWYLIRQILPQAIFAIVLLLLTSLAFYIAHRMLKKQFMLNNMKNDFVNNISHELKTPLSTVKVVIEALQDPSFRKDDKTIKEYLEMAALELNRLELLTGKVLNTSMMENGTLEIHKEKTDLLQLTKDLIQTLKLRLTKENAEVYLHAEEGDYNIEADPMHIQGALMNIIDNSLKYGKEQVKIKINLHAADDKVFWSLSDNGPGIADEYKEKVFEKFFRVPAGNIHNIKGHGLGLSYVDMVLKMHNGKVNVRNNEEAGCTFTLEFKRK